MLDKQTRHINLHVTFQNEYWVPCQRHDRFDRHNSCKQTLNDAVITGIANQLWHFDG